MLCRVCFHRILHRISSIWSLLYYTCSHPALSLLFYATSLLLLSYYTMSISCLISLAIYLPASVCLCSRHDFQGCLWFRFIDTRVCIYARHLALASPLAREFWLFWILMSRFRSLKLVDSPGCWSEMRSGSMDPQQTVKSPILPGPSVRLSSFSSVNSWAPFIPFILVHLIVFSHLRLSVM